MTEWPPFVIESHPDDPAPSSGWDEVVFELEDSEGEAPALIRERAAPRG